MLLDRFDVSRYLKLLKLNEFFFLSKENYESK